ncbi:hypothetical protein OF83DRAFT_1189230 [Amylostereum chailletii]|nr:hypothetical protein OF83DRAFT_1189230 [Amylostereum chailletii]
MSRFDQNKLGSSGMTSRAIQDDNTAPSIDETFVFNQDLAAPPLVTGGPLFQNHYAFGAPNAYGRADDALFFHNGQGTLPSNDVSYGLSQQSQYRPDAPFDFGGLFSTPHAHAQQSVGPWIPNVSVNDYIFPSQQQMFHPTEPQNFTTGFDNMFQQNEHRAPQPDPLAFDVFSLPFTPQSVNPHPPAYIPQQAFQPFRLAPAPAATYERGYQAVSHPSDPSLVAYRPAPQDHGGMPSPSSPHDMI